LHFVLLPAIAAGNKTKLETIIKASLTGRADGFDRQLTLLIVLVGEVADKKYL